MPDPRWAEALARLPDYLTGHVRVSAAAFILGLLVSLPLAIAARERPVIRNALLAVASVVQTIPGLALLALFYPVLLVLGAFSEQWFGFRFSAFGFLPAMLALALYAALPILQNTITGLMGIDPSLREAAQTVGMTKREALLMVELPLAFPVIMAGLRTAAVWVIGTATLSTPIGQTSLGNYIFTGLQTQNWVFVLFGCVAAALLALLVDQFLALMARGRNGRRVRVALGSFGLAVLIAGAFIPSGLSLRASYVVGAKTFTEQYMLAALISQRLQEAGLSAQRREGLGSNVVFAALAANEIDVYVDYSGTLWANQLHRTDQLPRDQLIAALKTTLAAKWKVTLLGELGFENAYALVIRRGDAERLGIRSIADLARYAPDLTIAGDYEFFSRPEWGALSDAYGLPFKAQRQMQPDFMYAALAAGEIDVIAGYTSDGLIAKYNLLVLDDPKKAIPPYDAVLLISPRRSQDQTLVAALEPLLGRITIETVRNANLRGSEGLSADNVARWLWQQAAPR